MAVLPIKRITGSVLESLQLTQRLGEHWGIELSIYYPIAPSVLFEQRRRKMKILKSATATPRQEFRHPSGVISVDHLVQAWNDMRVAMLSELDHNPSTSPISQSDRCCPTGRGNRN